MRFFHILLNTKSLKLDPSIIAVKPPRRLGLSLGGEAQPSMDEIKKVIKGMAHWKAVGSDGLPAGMLELDDAALVQ